MRYIVMDIDGCISNDNHRRDLIPKKPEQPSDYDAYNELMTGDLPMNVAKFAPLVHSARVSKDRELVFVTARPSRYRAQTEHWLWAWFGIKDPVLLMRPDANLMPSPELKVWLLITRGFKPEHIHSAYDDREDVLAAYRKYGIESTFLMGHEEPLARCKVVSLKPDMEADELLADMAETYAERNANYHSNYKQVGEVMNVLHGLKAPVPAAEVLQSVDDFTKWHLYELMIVKLTRFANSGLKHADSIHDLAIYAAMVEARVKTEEKKYG